MADAANRERERERDRERARRRRAAHGARPHTESLSRKQPWLLEGQSRRTWERRRAAKTSVHPLLTEGVRTDEFASLEKSNRVRPIVQVCSGRERRAVRGRPTLEEAPQLAPQAEAGEAGRQSHKGKGRTPPPTHQDGRKGNGPLPLQVRAAAMVAERRIVAARRLVPAPGRLIEVTGYKKAPSPDGHHHRGGKEVALEESKAAEGRRALTHSRGAVKVHHLRAIDLVIGQPCVGDRLTNGPVSKELETTPRRQCQ
jgi:hypothetical protein